MKKNNNVKNAIIILVGILLFILFISTFVYIHREKMQRQEAQIKKQEVQVKERAIENASKNGYSIQDVDEKEFCIKNDEVTYCFIIDASGVNLYYCEFPVEEDGVKVKEGGVLLTIYFKENDNVYVSYDDSRILIDEEGKEQLMFCGSHFISNTNFDKESLVIDYFLPDAEQKAIDAYETIMDFTSVEDLKEHYNKALSICEQLNEGL